MSEQVQPPDRPSPVFIPRRLADYSRSSLIAEIRRVAALLPPNGPITLEDFAKHSMAHWSTIRRRFGGWHEALTAPGLGDRFDASNKKASEGDLIAELRRVADEVGAGGLTKRSFQENAKFGPDSVLRRFGSWRAALRRAGLNGSKLGQRYTDEECFENLLRVWTYYGRAPFHREMKSAPSTVGPKAYLCRWGTWNKAIHAFANRVQSDIKVEEAGGEAPAGVPAANPRRAAEEDRHEIRLGLRYAVLSRDRFRCVLCGATPARNPE